LTFDMATAARRLLTVEEFLELDIELEGVPRVELDNGVILAMAGGSGTHNRVQSNVMGTLFERLKGSGCRPYGPDMGVRTHDLSLRYPDVSVFCGREGPENDKLKQFDDPTLIVEILSPSTRRRDKDVKLPEYRAMPSLKTILYIDPDAQKVQLSTRTQGGGWRDFEVDSKEDVVLVSLGISIAWAEIFAR
jgi:Uma2 family endonuclease